MRELTANEVEHVAGALTTEEVAAGLLVGAFVLGSAGQVLRFIPGAQLASAGMSVLGLGLGGLSGALMLSDKVAGTMPVTRGSGGCSGMADQCIVITGSSSRADDAQATTASPEELLGFVVGGGWGRHGEPLFSMN